MQFVIFQLSTQEEEQMLVTSESEQCGATCVPEDCCFRELVSLVRSGYHHYLIWYLKNTHSQVIISRHCQL